MNKSMYTYIYSRTHTYMYIYIYIKKKGSEDHDTKTLKLDDVYLQVCHVKNLYWYIIFNTNFYYLFK